MTPTLPPLYDAKLMPVLLAIMDIVAAAGGDASHITYTHLRPMKEQPCPTATTA